MDENVDKESGRATRRNSERGEVVQEAFGEREAWCVFCWYLGRVAVGGVLAPGQRVVQFPLITSFPLRRPECPTRRARVTIPVPCVNVCPSITAQGASLHTLATRDAF